MEEKILEVLRTKVVLLDWQKIGEEIVHQCSIDNSPVITADTSYNAMVKCIEKYE